MNTRKNRTKRIKYDQDDYVADFDEASEVSCNDPNDQEEARKSRIRDSNKEFARRMTILQTWSDHWSDYTTREGEAYPQQIARDIVKKGKKITCPIASCGKAFTSVGGLKYHYARCNIERSFKCKVCNPFLQVTTRGELLRHMILAHCDDLPALNDDQRSIVNSYLSCDRSDRSKKDRKTSGDTEGPLNPSGLVSAYGKLVTRTFSADDFFNRPFKHWQSSSKDWELVTHDFERRKFYPPETESVRLKFSENATWQTLKVGECMVMSKDKRGLPVNAVFFTGGSNTASAWLPKSSLSESHHHDYLDLVAIAVNCSPMDQSQSYKDAQTGLSCVQFWKVGDSNQIPDSILSCNLSFMVGLEHGIIFEMLWCPLGTSWQPPVNNDNALARVGLLALACGDGQIRILSVPHSETFLPKTIKRYPDSIIESTPLFKAKPIATLMAPGVGPSTDYDRGACKSIAWNIEDNQRLIVAGYSNGNVALFDLANNSPILYSNIDHCQIFQPIKSWPAHGAPITAVAISSSKSDKALIATGSFDRQLKLWNPKELSSCITTDRAPITRVSWDYRFRGIIIATDTAFTSFNNRVSYRYPVADGYHNLTVSAHRSNVWGLSQSVITSAVATSDGAGEVFVVPQLIYRSLHKRDKSPLSTHSLFTLLPEVLEDCDQDQAVQLSILNNLTNHNGEQHLTEVVIKQEDEGDNEDGCLEIDADFSAIERQIANKPNKFLLPIEYRPVETYTEFKSKYGLKFIDYKSTIVNPDSKLPESCIRAGDTKNIYCDRSCDYPFSAINMVSWSQNTKSFSYLLSGAQVGLCRLDRVPIVEQIYRGYVDTLNNNAPRPTNIE